MATKANVRVYTRTRPFNEREKAIGGVDKIAFRIDEQEISIPSRKKRYAYDLNFGPDSSQEDVFNVVGVQVTDDFMKGYNATQFVYGQTGSGKTWTMMGTDQLKGIIPRSSTFIFESIAQRPEGWQFEIHCTYLEIFMEEINDLLDPGKTKLKMREDMVKGVFVPGLTKEGVENLDEIYQILERGSLVKKMAETAMNKNSSRSHTIFTIHLTQTTTDGKQEIQSQLNLVDLAGSERASNTRASGARLKEAAKINLSLTTLAQVIQVLAEGGSSRIQPPYRNSTLTRLLKPALGGNARTGLSIHLSPHESNLEQTISTLEFGSRAKKVKTKAKTNVKKTWEQLMAEIEKMRKDCDRLKRLIARMSGGKLPPELRGMDGIGDEEDEDEVRNAAVQDALEAERQKLADLQKVNEELKAEGDAIKNEVTLLEEELQAQHEVYQNHKKDVDIKIMEQQVHEAHLRSTMQVVSETRGTSQQAELQKKELQELQALVKQQKLMLDNERQENRLLEDDNRSLSNDVTDKTRMLALTELKLMDHEAKREQEQATARQSARRRGSETPRRRNQEKARMELDNLTYRNMLGPEVLTARGPGKGQDVDYESMRKGTVLERFGGTHPISADDLKGGRDGVVKERVSSKSDDFVRRHLVLVDSYLLTFEEEELSLASTQQRPPQVRSAICISSAKVGPFPPVGEEVYCMVILCGADFNVFAVSTDAERTIWLRDMDQAKFATHRNLVNLAYFNEHATPAIPDKTVADKIIQRVLKSPFASMGKPEYALSVPCTGGMQGYVHSTGVYRASAREGADSDWRVWFCLVRNSHMLVYDTRREGGDRQMRPIHAIYLGESADVRVVEGRVETEEEEGGEGKYYVSMLQTRGSGLGMNMYVTSDRQRQQWMQAIAFGRHVTIQNVMRGAIAKETITVEGAAKMLMEDGFEPVKTDPNARDLLGRLLCVGAMQPFDRKGKPMHHHHDGQLLRHDLKTEADPSSQRYSIEKKPLDSFDRLLPRGAAAMYTANAEEAVGVGIDGKHYAYPSGRVLAKTDPHFDGSGLRLSDEVVQAAKGVLPMLKTAATMRSAVLNRDKFRRFDGVGRPLSLRSNGQWMTLEHEPLPPEAQVFDSLGEPTDRPSMAGAGGDMVLRVCCHYRDGRKHTVAQLTGLVPHTTLTDIYQTFVEQTGKCLASAAEEKISVTFVADGMAVPSYEHGCWFASDLAPEVAVICRGSKDHMLEPNGSCVELTIDAEALIAKVDKTKRAEYDNAVSAFKRKKRQNRGGVKRDSAPTLTPRSAAPASARHW